MGSAFFALPHRRAAALDDFIASISDEISYFFTAISTMPTPARIFWNFAMWGVANWRSSEQSKNPRSGGQQIGVDCATENDQFRRTRWVE